MKKWYIIQYVACGVMLGSSIIQLFVDPSFGFVLDMVYCVALLLVVTGWIVTYRIGSKANEKVLKDIDDAFTAMVTARLELPWFRVDSFTPNDGSFILFAEDDDSYGIVGFYENGKYYDEQRRPVFAKYWMPLLKSPLNKEE